VQQQFYDDAMTIQIDVTQLGPALVEDLSQNGGEITLTRDGKAVAKLVRVDIEATTGQPRPDGKVLYEGRWMIPEAAERERSIEHLRGSGKVLGDIVSPLDDVEWDESDGPMAGSILYQGDIVSPLDEEWDADK
jgi:antitoxin (DNA-binding transcriptional repressor) of toxin-antitoxin stability system